VLRGLTVSLESKTGGVYLFGLGGRSWVRLGVS